MDFTDIRNTNYDDIPMNKTSQQYTYFEEI